MVNQLANRYWLSETGLTFLVGQRVFGKLGLISQAKKRWGCSRPFVLALSAGLHREVLVQCDGGFTT
jgi:hypothetical protein